MEKLKKCKKTLLFVTHDLELATGFADKVIVLNRGKLLFFGDTKTGVEYYLEGSKEKIFSLRKETFQFQDYLLKMAGLLEKKGDMAKAEKYFVKILKSHTNVENLKRAGWFYKKWGKLSKSFEYFKKALELSPKDIECRNELIDNLGISGNRSELCDFLRFSLKATPEDLSLHSQIIFHGEPDEVLKAAEQIFMLNLENNEDINLLLKVASVFEKNEDYYKTERILIRVLKLNPELHDANLLLANIEYLRKKFDCSIKICDKLINDNPEERNAYIIKMRCIFENSGDCIELVNHCNIMIDRFSGLQEFMLILRCTHEMGNSKKFDEYLSHFHEYFPEFKNLFKKIL
ncbi:hypothetical protein KAJ27_20045 [bacterium]|nr:hypothetical protein [bacterium]